MSHICGIRSEIFTKKQTSKSQRRYMTSNDRAVRWSEKSWLKLLLATSIKSTTEKRSEQIHYLLHCPGLDHRTHVIQATRCLVVASACLPCAWGGGGARFRQLQHQAIKVASWRVGRPGRAGAAHSISCHGPMDVSIGYLGPLDWTTTAHTNLAWFPKKSAGEQHECCVKTPVQ